MTNVGNVFVVGWLRKTRTDKPAVGLSRVTQGKPAWLSHAASGNTALCLKTDTVCCDFDRKINGFLVDFCVRFVDWS